MSAATAADQLSKAIGHATRSAHFCVAGCLPVVDPGMEVDGLGAIKLPLKRARAKELIARCRVAPYGKGTETLVNRKVRDTLELDPRSFRLSQHWDVAIAEATRLVAGQLGLPADEVEARLYKLLVYDKGGFFLPHRDSEKHDGMVASLIVVLPNPFEGGAPVVRHGAVQQSVVSRMRRSESRRLTLRSMRTANTRSSALHTDFDSAWHTTWCSDRSASSRSDSASRLSPRAR